MNRELCTSHLYPASWEVVVFLGEINKHSFTLMLTFVWGPDKKEQFGNQRIRSFCPTQGTNLNHSKKKKNQCQKNTVTGVQCHTLWTRRKGHMSVCVPASTAYTDVPVPLSLQYCPGNREIYTLEELSNSIFKAEPSFTQRTLGTVVNRKLRGSGGYGFHCETPACLAGGTSKKWVTE